MLDKFYLTLCISLFLFTSGYSDGNTAPKELKIAADCKDAIKLAVAGESKYGPARAPSLFGNIQEITTHDKNSQTAFSEEHNSAWYLLNMKIQGEFEFEVVPIDITNDYDFLLYKYTDSNFCSALLQGKVKPIRGNISNIRNNHGNGTTGLSTNAGQQFHQQGQGNSFSESLNVNKDEKYVLVLDNVTPNGKGHTIYFHNQKTVDIKGVVMGPDSIPLVADVQLADAEGRTVYMASTNAQGGYEIKTPISENRNYSLTFVNDSSFVASEVINTANLKPGEKVFPNIKTVLPKLKKGGKYTMGNINFYGNEAVLLPESYPSAESLCRLMLRNKKMVIRIEGHVNGANGYEQLRGQYQQLSDDRAKAVYDILGSRGISRNRMSTIGYAAKYMLFPYAQNALQEKANRRVEIKVVSIDGD